MPILIALRYLWVFPASVIGICLTVAALVLGARARLHTGVLEVSLLPRAACFGRLLAYPAESLIQLAFGRHPYRDNRFEVSALAAEQEPEAVQKT